MKELFNIYQNYEELSDKGTRHSYIDFYEGLFLFFKNKEINLLEVGVLNGASLSMWQDYFVNAKNIVGLDWCGTDSPWLGRNGAPFPMVDTEFNAQRAKWDPNKVHTVEGDSRNPDVLEKPHIKENEFDIIIDDGSHYYRNQLKTFSNLYPKLKTGGIYIVEDVKKLASWRFLLYYKELEPAHINFRPRKLNVFDDQLIVFFK